MVGLAAVGAVCFAVVAWAIPWYVRRRCIDEAADRGISLSIDSVEIHVDGFLLVGVGATLAEVPGAGVRAPEVRVQTSGLRPQVIRVRGAELTLDGDFRHVAAAFGKWKASLERAAPGAWGTATVALEGSRAVWQGIIGENAKVEADDLHLHVTWPAYGPEVHVRSDRVLLGVPGGTLGPWRIDIDRVPEGPLVGDGPPRAVSSRVRLALDPGVPDSSTVLVVGDDDRSTSVDVSVPRSPLGRLGVPPQLIGLRGKDLQVEATAHYGALGPNRAEASTKGGLHGIEAPGIPLPLDVTWEGAASGSPQGGLDLKNARLAVGPLAGAMTGMLKVFSDGFRLDLAWIANPAPCKAFDTALGAGTPLDIGFQLRKLAEAAGLTKIEGEVRARAALTFDSRDLGATRLDFTPEANCQVALFGR
jgi:hypothetical protein